MSLNLALHCDASAFTIYYRHVTKQCYALAKLAGEDKVEAQSLAVKLGRVWSTHAIAVLKRDFKDAHLRFTADFRPALYDDERILRVPERDPITVSAYPTSLVRAVDQADLRGKDEAEERAKQIAFESHFKGTGVAVDPGIGAFGGMVYLSGVADSPRLSGGPSILDTESWPEDADFADKTDDFLKHLHLIIKKWYTIVDQYEYTSDSLEEVERPLSDWCFNECLFVKDGNEA